MPFLNKIIVFLFFCFFVFLTMPASATEFDPNYLISDTEITDYNAMNLTDIQNFLDKKNGTLKSYITVDKEGNFKTAPQTFYEVSQTWMVNPKYLLVLVQKEQSLLDDVSPTQGQYDWATGYGCPDNGGCDVRWQGFYKQVNSAAAQTRYYMDNINEFTYQPGRSYNIDGETVTPKNTATAGLYNYTPHLHGNQIFWNLWNQYFAKKWPDGSLLQADDGDTVYLIESGLRREIVSKAVFASRFDTKKIIVASSSDVLAYDGGVPVKYLNFSFLKNPTGDIYMIIDDQKRKIESQDVFKQLGIMEDEVISVTNEELTQYKNGPNITQYTLYPAGALLQNNKANEIYYVISGRKKLVANQEILNANFQGLSIKKISPTDLDQYPSGDPVTLPDGMLIKIKKVNTVYVISNGKRLPIFNAKIFTNMKYNWKNVITVLPETLEVHPLGQTITGEW